MAINLDVDRIMTREVLTIGPETVVPEIARLLWEHQISGVPVVEEGKVLGMVTEYDLIARESEYDAPLFVPFLDAFFRVPGTGDSRQRLKKILATTARELMTSPALVAAPTASVREIATLLVDKGLTAVPIVDAHEQLVGIVSRSDIVRLMVVTDEIHDRR
ncbi:MAG TPA: CBS domain-containing protein [Thermomicrobiaceae bacterium]|nr:CBS domain-containing protein [Thermomicrobiaceae bacterium]